MRWWFGLGFGFFVRHQHCYSPSLRNGGKHGRDLRVCWGHLFGGKRGVTLWGLIGACCLAGTGCVGSETPTPRCPTWGSPTVLAVAAVSRTRPEPTWEKPRHCTDGANNLGTLLGKQVWGNYGLTGVRKYTFGKGQSGIKGRGKSLGHHWEG